MSALLAALMLMVPTGDSDALDVVADGRNSGANVDSSLSVSAADSGNPSQETLDPPGGDPPGEDPPPEDPQGDDNVAPDILEFGAMVTPSDTLSVEGRISDNEPEGVTIHISWLDAEHTVSAGSQGQFFWQIALGPDDEGLITAVAIDSLGLESDPKQDFVFQP
jgi:hypothetical protein